jgi:hypothetical protein
MPERVLYSNSDESVRHNELVSDVDQISDFRTLLSTLSPDARTRGKQFERVTKWWLEAIPEWSWHLKSGPQKNSA